MSQTLSRSETTEELARAFADRPHDVGSARACPDPDELWEAIHGRLPAERRRELVQHTVDCPACAEEWRIAMALAPPGAAGEVAAAGRPARTPRGSRTGRALPWIAAAAAVLALVVGLPLLDLPTFDRGAQTPVVHRGAAPEPGSGPLASRLEEGAVLPRGEMVLAWQPGPEGSEYELEVAAADPDLVFYEKRGLTEPRHRVPAGALARASSGEPLYWYVRALTPEGEIESELFTVHVE